MTKEINAHYVYIFSESDAIRPSSAKSWSTLFSSTIDLGGDSTSPPSETTNLSTTLSTPTTRQSNYDDALRISQSASSSVINPIARSANIQLEEITIHDEKRGKSPIASPHLLATKTKGYNGTSDSSKEKSNIKDDVSTKEYQAMMDKKFRLGKTDVGVISKDPKLNKDPKQLYNFFKSNNDKPEMAITIHGYRTEEKDGKTQVISGSHGYEYEKRDMNTVEITDFSIKIDLSDHILPQEEYCNSSVGFKEIEMIKVIIWDYDSLSKVIATIIRQQHYYNNIKISYPLRNNVVKVQSTSTLYSFTKNKWIKIFCLLTCLWIIFWPIWWLYRKVYSVQIKSEFRMKIKTKEWFENNVSHIVSKAKLSSEGGK
ncbi:ABC transporter [Rhizophagus clarus]|uniref:ABC transporter n=1 Tax=Rhizophagus clarus TaxID=94130 RepID=A0A8H3L752_9GLOM|nr:ABC transporter [Rhizophagus clarus]